jgi:hypothetical protein
MRKLRLDPEALTVDSFDTAAGAASRRGTLHAHAAAGVQASVDTCDISCIAFNHVETCCGCTTDSTPAGGAKAEPGVA